MSINNLFRVVHFDLVLMGYRRDKKQNTSDFKARFQGLIEAI